MTPPEMRWTFILALLPDEIETLKAKKRVTKTYPKPLPYGPPPLLPEHLEALKGGSRVIKMTPPGWPPQFLQVGNIVPVTSFPPRGPPALPPEDLEALRAGKTITKTSAEPPPHPDPTPDLSVKVVEYRQQGHDHVYTFEAV